MITYGICQILIEFFMAEAIVIARLPDFVVS